MKRAAVYTSLGLYPRVSLTTCEEPSSWLDEAFMDRQGTRFGEWIPRWNYMERVVKHCAEAKLTAPTR